MALFDFLNTKTIFLRRFTHIVLFLFLLVLDTTVFPVFGRTLKFLNPLLDAVLFLTVVMNISTAFIWAGAAGIALDIYNSTSSGVHLFAFLITAALINLLFIRFFTNRSFYTLFILGITGQIIYAVSALGFLFGAKMFWEKSLNPFVFSGSFSFFVKSIFANVILLTAAFLALKKFSKSMRSTFLIK